ncbi:MAG: SPOR domain-containing protein [Deltaproteobacteria bacterium]|jgi:cell division protein FtsN|nr:SPOR domain-containing protein [Deltaproteobacteria bacterium]
MFFLGIIVGRGNSPVKFDTQKFQKRLETIAHDFGAQKKIPDKIDLKFYDVLDRPELEEDASNNKSKAKGKIVEILPKKEVVTNSILMKTSKKKETFKKGEIKIQGKNRPEVKKSFEKRDKKKIIPQKIPQGNYTVQIAAYKDFKDAVTEMAILEKKGISSYRIKGSKNGVTWYRVRSGSFADFDKATEFKKKLEKIKINSIIIKRDDNEDIKE